jgi:hypothetical protein
MLKFSKFAEFLKELISLKVLNELYVLKTNKNNSRCDVHTLPKKM